MSLATTPMQSGVEHDARILYNYHRLNMPVKRYPTVTFIFTLCSFDLRVAHRAVDLFYSNKPFPTCLIFSGRHGKQTSKIFSRPEAEVFADVARERGVPQKYIILERESTNTGENIRFTYKLLQAKDITPRFMILVQSPYMERRTYATFKKQWPEKTVQFSVTSPQLSFNEYPCEAVPMDVFIAAMVETLLRIKDYPEKGFQITQDIPDEV